MRSGRYARARMEAAISCKFHCKRLAERWRGYWPATDPAELAADIEVRPGHPLEDAGIGLEDRFTEIGRLVARLHTAGPPPSSFIHVGDFEPSWEIPAGNEEVLTHLDLHAGNALRTHGGWKAIDPKGVRADRHADVWALIDPLTLEGFPRDPAQAEASAVRWLECYAEAAEMDLDRAREWTRIRASAEAREVNDPDWAAALSRMAAALAVSVLILPACERGLEPHLGEGIGVRNNTSQTLRIRVFGDGEWFNLARLEPGQAELVLTGSAIGPSSRVVKNGCTVGELVAVNAAGDEVARRNPPLCVDETWVIEGDELGDP
jgi:hypothetical protein